ncbi:DUF5996 family protein [Pontibacter ruber]|uniref:DUF5996 family protein n=1 Tax=Pontibacter ruber TaxID=1343895 RepID=A0ABW5CZ80_9BACT|nr:DUF5996 family protein [Pontibacter ruber]
MNTDTTAQNSAPLFPPLPLTEWEATKETFHRYLQIVGKIRLKLMPRKNHWWHVPLYVHARGLTTGPIPYSFYAFEIRFDFIDHQLVIETSTGARETFALQDGLSVSQFYTSLFKALDVLGIKVDILAKPYKLKSDIAFAEDHTHATYNPEHIQRFWQILTLTNGIFEEFSGRFYGKTSPVHLFWHSLDLVVTRFSGRSVPYRPEAGKVEKDAYSHEVISFGFWPGDDNFMYPAFYSYTYPAPAGIDKELLQARSASWVDSNGSPMALLPYEEMRQEENPKQVLLDFLESAYQAGASLADWPIEELRVVPLEEL